MENPMGAAHSRYSLALWSLAICAVVFIGVELVGLNRTNAQIARELAQIGQRMPNGVALAGGPNVPAVFSGMPAAAVQPFDQTNLNTSISNDDVMGNKDAPLTLITYLDFECPFCKRFYPTARQFVAASGGAVNFVIRPYPLDIHRQASYLANAAECVTAQRGSTGFWAFADEIFSGASVDDDHIGRYMDPILKKLSVDKSEYDACIAHSSFAAVIDRDSREAKTVGVAGTPTSVLYDRSTHKAIFIPGAVSLDVLQDDARKLRGAISSQGK